MNFRYAPGADDDLFDLAAWFDARSAGQGARFAAAMAAFITRVQTFPRMYGRARGASRGRDVRVGMPQRFPALVHYEVTATEVVILSVGHASRRAHPWRRRLGP